MSEKSNFVFSELRYAVLGIVLYFLCRSALRFLPLDSVPLLQKIVLYGIPCAVVLLSGFRVPMIRLGSSAVPFGAYADTFFSSLGICCAILTAISFFSSSAHTENVGVIAWISALALAPFGEELLFRGILFGSIRFLGDTGAVIISSLVFGIIHPFGQSMLYAVVFGMMSALLFRKTGILLPCVVLHLVMNAVTLSASLFYAAGCRLFLGVLTAVFLIMAVAFCRFGKKEVQHEN